MKITIEQLPENIKTTEQFVKRMFFLLWKAASVAGMGFLQDRGEQPEDVVWERCKQGHDSGTIGKSINRLWADYTFGRMMNHGVEHIQQLKVSNKLYSIHSISYSCYT